MNPSYLAGHAAALSASPCAPPPGYTEAQRLAFVGGFLVGARDAREAELKKQLKEAGGE